MVDNNLIGHICESYHGFMFWYRPDAKEYLDRQALIRGRLVGGEDNPGTMSRIYAADKIVRISDGRVYKDRWNATEAWSEDDKKQLYGRI